MIRKSRLLFGLFVLFAWAALSAHAATQTTCGLLDVTVRIDSYTDVFRVSGKQDCLVTVGGQSATYFEPLAARWPNSGTVKTIRFSGLPINTPLAITGPSQMTLSIAGAGGVWNCSLVSAIDPAPRATITPDKSTIYVADTTAIRANFTAGSEAIQGTMINGTDENGANSASLPGLDPASGGNKIYSFTPLAPGTYTFYALANTSTFPWKTYAQCTVNVIKDVNYIPPSATITANPATLYTTKTTQIDATFFVDTAHHDQCLATDIECPTGTIVPGVNGSTPGNKSYSFTPTTPGDYTFYARMKTRFYPTLTTYKQVTVHVDQLPPPPTAALTASPLSGYGPLTTTLTWTTQNATLVTVTGSGVSASGTAGSATVTLNPGTYTYVLNASGLGGSTSNTCTIQVNVPPPPTASISASPTTGTGSLTTTINWSTSNAATVTVTGNGLNSSAVSGGGSVTLSPGTYTYTVTASGLGGTVSASCTVKVNVPNFVLTTNAIGPGSVTPGGTYPQNTGITVSETPATDARFMGWTGDTGFVPGDPRALDTSLYVSMTMNKNIVGNFAPKIAQTITFANIGIHDITEGGTTLSASASSGLPVTFTLVSGPGTVNGNVLTFNAPGTIVVQASQAGDATYLAAPVVNSTATVAGPAKISVTVGSSGTRVNQDETDDNLQVKIHSP